MPDSPDPLALARRWLDGYAAGPQTDRHADPTVAIAYILLAIAEDVHVLLVSLSCLAALQHQTGETVDWGLCRCARPLRDPEGGEIDYCVRCRKNIAPRAEGVTT